MRARGGFKKPALIVVRGLLDGPRAAQKRRWTPHAIKARSARHEASLTATAACASAFMAPISGVCSKNSQLVQPRRTRASVALESTRKDPRTGKIYVGEPEPLEELADLVGGLLGRRRRSHRRTGNRGGAGADSHPGGRRARAGARATTRGERPVQIPWHILNRSASEHYSSLFDRVDGLCN